MNKRGEVSIGIKEVIYTILILLFFAAIYVAIKKVLGVAQ